MREAGEVDIDVRLPERHIDVTLTVAPGRHVTLLGPNGAGKTSLLAMVAGTLAPASGRIRVGGVDVTSRPVHRRRVATLSQDALLFPHLTVLDNVAFGPRSVGLGRREARDRARHWLDLVDAAAWATRRPGQLSGGQAQRVAIARALAAEPDVLLLDEPMAALDVEAAARIRVLLARVLAGRTALIVTHDLLDVITLADRAVVLEDGKVVEDRPARELLASPRSAFGARLAKMVSVDGEVTEVGDGVVELATAAGPVIGVWHDAEPARPGAVAVALIDPAAVGMHPDRPGGSPRNCWRVEVERMEPHGSQVRVVARTSPAPGAPAGGRGVRLAADITPAAVAALAVRPGMELWFVTKAQQVRLYAEWRTPQRSTAEVDQAVAEGAGSTT